MTRNLITRRLVALAAAGILACGAIGAVGAYAAPQSASNAADTADGTVVAAASSQADSSATSDSGYAEGSLAAQHAARGIDFSNVTEVSIEQCAPCHGGSWEAIQQVTTDMWKGVGQISDANPHQAHATNGYVCSNCHNLTDGPSVQQCNGCHAFGVPEGWTEKDPTTTTYGLAEDEPLY